MDWEAVGAVGDLVAALAVVASLVYLALQIRHNTDQLEQQNRHHELTSLVAIESCFTHFPTLIGQSEQVASLWHRAVDDFDGLEPREKTQAEYLIREFF